MENPQSLDLKSLQVPKSFARRDWELLETAVTEATEFTESTRSFLQSL